MKHPYSRAITLLAMVVMLLASTLSITAQERRPVDSRHPMWLIHVDVWNKADPQKIIDLIPEEVKPFVVLNLSLSCQYDTEKNVYKMPQNAVRTYKSWGTVCQKNGMWFTCQPASGGHTHIQDTDLETFEYFYRRFPNFLGWNYAEQFWGFDEAGDRSSSTQASRIALFAKLVPMAHKYGGFLTISFCGNIWSHPLNPMGMMKRNKDLLAACREYPEAILWLYKYTTSSCFYANESVTFGPFISGLAKNYGVRYDNCGWNGALSSILGENHGKKYPVAAGIGTVMEQTCVNGGAVWDGPELIWTEDFQNLSDTQVEGYTRRNWGTFPGFKNAWLDMFQKIIDGTLYIPTREEVVQKTKIVVINNVSSGNDEQKYAAWGDLYDGIYKQTDPFNRGNGQWMDNFLYLKKTGRYGTIPLVIDLYDDLAKAIPVQVKKSAYTSRWSTQTKKQKDFNDQYPEVSKGDLYVNRYRNQLVTYTPYSYLNKKTTAKAEIPLEYNTCDTLVLTWGKLSSGLVREYADHIDFYLNNYRNDTTTAVLDQIIVRGATAEPSFTIKKRAQATVSSSAEWDADTHAYTLNVKHNGPVDLTISCSGAQEDVKTDVLPATSLAEDLPRQPEEYHGEIIIEAEDMDHKNLKSCVTDPYGWYPSVRGHAGNGFADMGTNTGGALKHVLTLAEAGDYDISIRYTQASRASRLTATVNGTRSTVALEKTATNEWKKATFSASLKAGKNTLIITNSAGIGIYVDQVIYTPAGTPAERFLVTVREGEHGAVVADVTEAAEGEVVHLSVVPEEGYALAGWTIDHGGITIDEDNSFVMPDDNVTLTPLFKDMTAVYRLDFTDVLSGTLPEGWRTTQGGGEVHEYPNSYSSGARTFVGFGGYQGKGLYWRESNAEFGRQAKYPLTLQPGYYRLTYACAAWKGTPKYRARILTEKNKTLVQSGIHSATPNADGNTSANLTSAKTYTLEFQVTEAGNYIINFMNNGSGFDEFLLLECRLNTYIPDGIEVARATQGTPALFDLTGVQQKHLRRGVNVVRTSDGRVHKVVVK